MRIISFHVLHDANVSITENGIPLAVLELESLFSWKSLNFMLKYINNSSILKKESLIHATIVVHRKT